jgi:hypothetical protein
VPSKRGGLAVASINQSISQSVNGNITYLDEENEEKNIIVYLTITKKYNSKDNESTSEPSIHLQDTI